MTRLALQEHRQRDNACQTDRHQREVPHTHMHAKTHTKKKHRILWGKWLSVRFASVAFLSNAIYLSSLFSRTFKQIIPIRREHVTINLEDTTISSQLCLHSLDHSVTSTNMCLCKVSRAVHLPEIILINLKIKIRKLIKSISGPSNVFYLCPGRLPSFSWDKLVPL